ncbi:hypothetical protein KA078_01515, partial [Candidatus Woesebacteria bacterium]|nr:hypothetical protein [Candidatus Woesebacteria bacterium]
MKTKQFYPLLALLFSLLLTLAFTGQAKAESTVADCGTSVNTSATITVTDDLDYGLTRFAATSPADVSICNEIAEPHWSIPMCGDEIWSGWVEVPTACNTVTISDTQVTQVTWIDESVMWDVSGQELIRATVTETVPTRVEIWEEDSGRKLILFNLDNTMFPVYLDSVVYNDWVDNGDGKKKLTINNATFNASFNLGDQPVIWENYAVYWRVSESNTVDRIKISPTRVEIWEEDSGRKLILFNLDNTMFPVYLDSVVYNDWVDNGD